MCGIAVITGNSKRTSGLESQAQLISDRLAHRGPDDSGIEIRRSPNDQTVALIHRRLAIIDLSSRAHQPMATPDKRFWIIFNGEIYNYRELRAELEESKTFLSSNSDTEVILHLYVQEGSVCLQKLRGMFAFCIWDEQKGELFFARDRFGIKPLYYAKQSGFLLVSSELKALLNSNLVSDEFNEQAEATFLRRGCIPAPQTFYRNIQALEPGCFARFDGQEVQCHSYWKLSNVFESASTKQTDASNSADEIKDSLINSVRAHMVSDVPVAVFLSGGLDSTAIVSSIRQFYSGPLKTISIVFPGTEWDESLLAREAAKYFSTDHVEVEISQKDFVQSLDDIFLAMDQPSVDGVNTYFVAKAAKQAGVKVALSGVGGDELLGGYQSFVDLPRLVRSLNVTQHIPGLSQHAADMAERLPITWGTKLSELLRNGSVNLSSLWQTRRALFSQNQLQNLIPAYKAEELPDLPETLNNPFWSISYLEMQNFLIPQLLRDSDVFTMHHGLELRTPFVDHLFLTSVLKSGPWSRNRAATYKIALFKKMRNFFPTEHLRNGKRGFTFPFSKWLKEILKSDSDNHISKFYAQYEYKPFVDRFLRNKLHWSRLWALYVLGRFKTEKAWISQ
jgi:asparagine synthase (glutamine-hydrolysing)